MSSPPNSTSDPGQTPSPLQSLVDHAKTLDCIHCGLCLQTCPTYRLTGSESASPRGRIHMMRSLGEGHLTPDAGYAEELDSCLLCRHCESVCPAGVEFGSMMETARDSLGLAFKRPLYSRILRHLGFRWLLPHRFALRTFGSLLRLVQFLRLDSLLARIGGKRARGIAELPRIAGWGKRKLLPSKHDSRGAARETVAFLEGCVMPEFFPEVNRASVRSLGRLGVTSHCLPGVVCCGSLHAHNGDLEGSRKLARSLLNGYEKLCRDLGSTLRIANNSAGCGAHMRELHNLFPEDDKDHVRARKFADQVVDYSEVVAPLLPAQQGLATELAAHPAASGGPFAWDDPCHLCHAQGIREEPRRVLEQLQLPLALLRDSESCCGSAGIYSLLRPTDSADIFAKKYADFKASGAQSLVTANPGCQLQWQAGLRRMGCDAQVFHLAELVDSSLTD